MHLSVVIPAYNEEKSIGQTLKEIGQYLRRQDYDWEILVVDNNSKDSTARVAEKLRAEIGNLHLIHQPIQGKGYAVTKGMLEARGDWCLFTDADNATTIDHLEKMWPYTKEDYAVVIGSLAVKGARIMRGGEEPLWRVILGKLGNKWIQFFAVWGVNDTQRGFKLFSTRAAKDIFSRLTVFGWGFDVEVLAIAKHFGYKIKEIPVTWNNNPNSRVNFWAYPQVLLQTLQVSWNLLTNKYK